MSVLNEASREGGGNATVERVCKDRLIETLKANVNRRHVFIDEYLGSVDISKFIRYKSLNESTLAKCIWVASYNGYSNLRAVSVTPLKKVFRNQPNIIKYLELDSAEDAAPDVNNPPVTNIICKQ